MLPRDAQRGRSRGATLVIVNGSSNSQNARDGAPEVSPPQAYPSSRGPVCAGLPSMRRGSRSSS